MGLSSIQESGGLARGRERQPGCACDRGAAGAGLERTPAAAPNPPAGRTRTSHHLQDQEIKLPTRHTVKVLGRISEKCMLMANGFFLTICEQRERASDSRVRSFVRKSARYAVRSMKKKNCAPHTDEQRGDRNPQREPLP